MPTQNLGARVKCTESEKPLWKPIVVRLAGENSRKFVARRMRASGIIVRNDVSWSESRRCNRGESITPHDHRCFRTAQFRPRNYDDKR
jgi:hypothetical protein